LRSHCRTTFCPVEGTAQFGQQHFLPIRVTAVHDLDHNCRLGEVGSTLYTRANLILCKRDYLRLFGTSGNCAACCKVIPAFEMVMRAKNNVYHLDCFSCSSCQQRFCVGDRFYLMDNKILCEYDYEERLIFANIHSSAATATQIQSQETVR